MICANSPADNWSMKSSHLGSSNSTSFISTNLIPLSTFCLKDLISYDPNNAKTYILEDGDYYFALGNGAHDALNNILAKQGKTGMYDAANNPVSGDVSKVQVVNLAALDNKTYAKSPYTC